MIGYSSAQVHDGQRRCGADRHDLVVLFAAAAAGNRPSPNRNLRLNPLPRLRQRRNPLRVQVASAPRVCPGAPRAGAGRGRACGLWRAH